MAPQTAIHSVPEWLHRLQYIACRNGSIDCNTLACQNGSIDCNTLACQNGSIVLNTLACQNGSIDISVQEWLHRIQNMSVPEYLASLQYNRVQEPLSLLHNSSVPEWLSSALIAILLNNAQLSRARRSYTARAADICCALFRKYRLSHSGTRATLARYSRACTFSGTFSLCLLLCSSALHTMMGPNWSGPLLVACSGTPQKHLFRARVTFGTYG